MTTILNIDVEGSLEHDLMHTSLGNALSPNARVAFVGSISGGRCADMTVVAIVYLG